MSQKRLTIAPLLVTSFFLMLACVGLGAFGGCNLGMVQMARGETENLLGSILLGVIFGLLAGLIGSFWDKSWARQSPPIRRRFVLRFGYASAWLLVALLSFRADWTKAHNWTPVKIPMRFDKQNTVSATFTADMSETYDVQIDLKRNLPFEDLNAFVGGWIDPDKPPHPGPLRPEIVWTVTNVPVEDRTLTWRDQYWGETVGLELGQFQAVAGRKYTITVQVVQPSPVVQILDPHLQIALTHILGPQYYIPAMIAQMGGIIAGGIGITLMVRSLAKLRREQRESPSS